MKTAGIDPSLTSTAVCLSSDEGDKFVLFGKPRSGKWWEPVKDVCEQVTVEYQYPSDYSSQDLAKVELYSETARMVAEAVAAFGPERVAIEGYSYSSQAGDLIDLVTFGSALRRELLLRGLKVTVLAPTELKSMSCAKAYGRDKKGVPRRPDGLAGGKFKKNEMLQALVDSEPDTSIAKALGDMAATAIGLAAVPKPIDDMVDAWWLSRMSANFAQQSISAHDIDK